MDTLEIFKSENTFSRRIIAGPTSGKNIPENMSLLDMQSNTSISSTIKGTDYALEYVQKEETELLQV